MSNFTQAEARKEINKIAKENGFIMKKQNLTINGSPCYRFEDRNSGRVLVSNMSFWVAYENALICELWLNRNN